MAVRTAAARRAAGMTGTVRTRLDTLRITIFAPAEPAPAGLH